MQIGQRLVTWRNLWGFSQRELARRAGLTNGTLSQIEQGNTSPSLQTIEKLAVAFGLDTQTFLFGEQTRPLWVVTEGAAPLLPLACGTVAIYNFAGAAPCVRRIQLAVGGVFNETTIESLQHTAQSIFGPAAASSLQQGEWLQFYLVAGDAAITVMAQHTTLLPGDACCLRRSLPFHLHALGDQPVELLLLAC